MINVTKPEQLMFLRREVQRENASFCRDSVSAPNVCCLFSARKVWNHVQVGWMERKSRSVGLQTCADNGWRWKGNLSPIWRWYKQISQLDKVLIHLHVHHGRVNFCPPRKISNKCQMSPWLPQPICYVLRVKCEVMFRKGEVQSADDGRRWKRNLSNQILLGSLKML